MKEVIEGRVWTLGPNVDTDQIISGKYLTIIDPEELKKHVFEIALPEFAKEARAGDLLVAGENFGCGSSREHAPQAMRAIGARYSKVVASGATIPVFAPISVVMLQIVSRSGIDSDAIAGPVNSTAL